MISTSGNGHGSAGDDGFSLAEALGGLSLGAEPPMPDLVPGAIERGGRIRRRRRIGTALGSAAVVAALLTGGYAVLLPVLPGAGGTTASPAAPGTGRERAVVYPSLEVLRSAVPAATGTVEAAAPERPVRPGRYFLLTTPKGMRQELYVSITRTATGPKALREKSGEGDVACPARTEDAYATGWNGLTRQCRLVPWKTGPVLLYAVATGQPTAAVGVTYMTADGWTVQVIAGSLDGSRTGYYEPLPDDQLISLAVDPALLTAVKDN
ncbi:hypothetical protein [Streptomyces paludis]|uniref:Uncharacterized protein n=1 Tax=Streptomyces paludis TaxID=2282738 RepID=A0A345HLH9_9ACTN|nr:hypothetical protein [Streptomyces paludis]AXG77553.1 hypothetical protein DVK44_07415 [Streptomyces paludis]